LYIDNNNHVDSNTIDVRMILSVYLPQFLAVFFV